MLYSGSLLSLMFRDGMCSSVYSYKQHRLTSFEAQVADEPTDNKDEQKGSPVFSARFQEWWLRDPLPSSLGMHQYWNRVVYPQVVEWCEKVSDQLVRQSPNSEDCDQIMVRFSPRHNLVLS